MREVLISLAIAVGILSGMFVVFISIYILLGVIFLYFGQLGLLILALFLSVIMCTLFVYAVRN